jgi:thiosulfate reductase cytochrome b subunit
MSSTTQRSVVRWIHIVLAIPIIGYIYSPFEKIPSYAPVTRCVYVPLLVISGLWMWKGHIVKRLFSKGTTQPTVPLQEAGQLK